MKLIATFYKFYVKQIGWLQLKISNLRTPYQGADKPSI